MHGYFYDPFRGLHHHDGPAGLQSKVQNHQHGVLLRCQGQKALGDRPDLRRYLHVRRHLCGRSGAVLHQRPQQPVVPDLPVVPLPDYAGDCGARLPEAIGPAQHPDGFRVDRKAVSKQLPQGVHLHCVPCPALLYRLAARDLRHRVPADAGLGLHHRCHRLRLRPDVLPDHWRDLRPCLHQYRAGHYHDPGGSLPVLQRLLLLRKHF